MAGKAPLLLASVLFAVGAVGLALTSAEQASWGPFRPPVTQPEQRVIIVNAGAPYVEVPALLELLMPPPTALAAAEPETPVYAAVSQSAPEATATPIPPLRVFGISADDGGVSAAAATPATPPPLRIVNVASDDGTEPAAETETETETEAETETETPTPEAEPAGTPEPAD